MKNIKRDISKHFDLKVGFTCNNNCFHCVVGLKKYVHPNDLSLNEIKQYINKYVLPYDIGTIVLTGGEVTIRKDFIKIIKYIASKGLNIAIQTNGTGLVNKKIVKAIKPYVSEVLIAIHSCNEYIHNDIVGVTNKNQNRFQQTLTAMDNLYKYNIPFETQTVISIKNKDTLYQTLSFLSQRYKNIKMHLTYPHPLGNAYSKFVAVKYSDIKTEIQKCVNDFGSNLITEAIPCCVMHPNVLNVYFNIDLDLMNRFYSKSRTGIDVSNSNNRKDDKLIDNAGYSYNYALNDLTGKAKGRRCIECIYNEVCPGVWREYIEFYKNELDLFPITKEI